jgi:DNA-binding response OmpR family regulator
MPYGTKILLVDDETDYLTIVATILRNRGLDVYSISSGDNLFFQIGNYRPDLIVLDVNLGHFDGREICRQLKSYPATAKIKIILHSAYKDISKDYQLYGADEFILKPYPVNYLLERIKHYFPETRTA